MLKLYEHQITNGDHAEAISVETDSESIRVAVTDTVHKTPFIDEVQTTSIELSPEGVAPLIEALLQSISEDGHALVKLNAHHLKVLIYSLELALDAHDGEIGTASQPYDLLKALNTELNCLIERDTKNNKD